MNAPYLLAAQVAEVWMCQWRVDVFEVAPHPAMYVLIFLFGPLDGCGGVWARVHGKRLHGLENLLIASHLQSETSHSTAFLKPFAPVQCLVWNRKPRNPPKNSTIVSLPFSSPPSHPFREPKPRHHR